MNVTAITNRIKRTRLFQRSRAKQYFSSVIPHTQNKEGVKGAEHWKYCYQTKTKTEQYHRLFELIDIKIVPGKRFQSWIDPNIYVHSFAPIIDNMPPNYEFVINRGFKDMEEYYGQFEGACAEVSTQMLGSIREYVRRVVKSIEEALSSIGDGQDRELLLKTREHFVRMESGPASSLEEALQRILFWSSMFWQSKHRLVGLGRLDKILAGISSSGKAESIDVIIDFYDELHRYYDFKSNRVALGDTGQIIILGGLDEDGSYFCNDYTYLFIEALDAHRLPDPKLMLRVSQGMPEDLLDLAVELLGTGVGCPILANDEVIVPALEEFGYTRADACNYVVSACWEPLSYAKSLEQNNMADFNFAQAFVDAYSDEGFGGVASYEDVLSMFYAKLGDQINGHLSKMSQRRWEDEPLYSMLMPCCLESGKDLSAGGAVYNNYGVLTVGMANTVDSLLYMKRHVFEEGDVPLDAILSMLRDDYPDEDERIHIADNSCYFGRDDEEVLELVRDIVSHVSDTVAEWRNGFGGRVKFGLSSSGYLEYGRTTGTTLDGRRAGAPLATHLSGRGGEPYTALVGFASMLDYAGCRSNGNVVDFFVSPALMDGNEAKFAGFVRGAIDQGFFEMQMNVVGSKTLIDAKEHPELHKDLIVRVWGFSAYFVDLPDEYQDMLIARALDSERECA